MNFDKQEDYIYEIISHNIKIYRKKSGLTQEELAEKIDYSLSFIRGIESNYQQTFSIGAIYRIALVLEIEFTKLFEDPFKEPDYYKCPLCGNTTSITTKEAEIIKSKISQ